METWLILDTSYLAWRNFHALGKLDYEGARTEVAYGVFRDIATVMDRFATRFISFAFDTPPLKRRDIYPAYKEHRAITEDDDPEEVAARAEVIKQLEQLRTESLPSIGFLNVWWSEGCEADDLIATGCRTVVDNGYHAVIVASDADLFQLLRPNVSMWNPVKKNLITLDTFVAEWGISPSQWADVKAIAGCSSDGIVGIPGVGEKTAAKFIKGKLNPTTKAFNKIVSNDQLWKTNIELTKLPYPGTPVPRLKADHVTKDRWRTVARSLGITSVSLV